MRLDKFLADMQLGSRKEVKALIKKGLIQVDGQMVRTDKTQIDETKAQVTFDGEDQQPAETGCACVDYRSLHAWR